MSGELFKKYYTRLMREGIIKSLLWSLVAGFTALFLSSAVLWFTVVELFWVSIVVFVLTTAASTVLFYYTKFKPTTKQIAMRIDSLGLEERILTMTELEKDESYIAMRQREDALKALERVNEKSLTIAIAKTLIIWICVAGVFGMGMFVVTVLSVNGILPSGRDWIEEVTTPEPESFELIYEEPDKGGYLEGELFQIVEEGGSGTPVVAIAEDGWAFSEWSDGKTDPYRVDINVKDNLTVKAYFVEVMDSGDGDGGGDEPTDLPLGEGQDDGEGPGQGPGAGGEYEPSNQVIDGDTFYGYMYSGAYEETLESLAGNTEMPPELKQLIANYFEAIKLEGKKPGAEDGESNQ